MDERLNFVQRMAILTELVRQLGETRRIKLMKLVYLLQTLRHLPLGYRFQLYLYGPYDAQVLSDVGVAESWNALHEEYQAYGESAYGYKIRVAPDAQSLLDMESETLQKYREAIDWVVREFGNKSAAILELIATIVWIDRESARDKRTVRLQELAEAAHNLKSHFSLEAVLEEVRQLQRQGVLLSVQAD